MQTQCSYPWPETSIFWPLVTLIITKLYWNLHLLENVENCIVPCCHLPVCYRDKFVSKCVAGKQLGSQPKYEHSGRSGFKWGCIYTYVCASTVCIYIYACISAKAPLSDNKFKYVMHPITWRDTFSMYVHYWECASLWASTTTGTGKPTHLQLPYRVEDA
jgi:hypothetical protein